jgi:hypothetical protein
MEEQARAFQTFAGSFLNHLREANMKTTQESFRKRVFCPSSETILEYIEMSMSAQSRQRIRGHIESCDFCAAELYFLSRHRLLDEPSLSSTRLSQVRVVVENVSLDGPRQNEAQRAA